MLCLRIVPSNNVIVCHMVLGPVCEKITSVSGHVVCQVLSPSDRLTRYISSVSIEKREVVSGIVVCISHGHWVMIAALMQYVSSHTRDSCVLIPSIVAVTVCRPLLTKNISVLSVSFSITTPSTVHS